MYFFILLQGLKALQKRLGQLGLEELLQKHAVKLFK